MNVRSLATVGIFVTGLATVSAQQNWPQFRGPDAGVIADNPALPESGARPRTSSGRRQSRDSDGVRPSSGAITSS